MPASKRAQRAMAKATRRNAAKPATVDTKANKAIESKNWRKDAAGTATNNHGPLIDLSTPKPAQKEHEITNTPSNSIINADQDEDYCPLYGKDFTKIVLKASEPLTLVRLNGATVTLPHSFLVDISPVDKSYVSSGDHSSLSIGELKVAKNPRRLRTQTDQDIDFDQKHQVFHFKKIQTNRCISIAPEYLAKNSGARYDRVMKEKEASALMEHDEAIDRIGGVDAKSPQSARQKAATSSEEDEKKKAFQALLSRLSKSGPPPKCDFSKAGSRSKMPILELQFKQPSVHSPPTEEISPPSSAHSDKDSGYDSASPVKKLNPIASEFKDPTVVVGNKQVRPQLHVNNVSVHPQSAVPMPAGLPPMKPFGMPFDSDYTANNNNIAAFQMMLPTPQLDGKQNPMGLRMLPPQPMGALGGGFPSLPPNMMPTFPVLPPLPPMPMDLVPMFNNNNGGNHFNTFPHCGPPLPTPTQFNQGPPPNIHPLATINQPPLAAPAHSILPLTNQNPNPNNQTKPLIPVTAGATAPAAAPAIIVPPQFPVTKKPRNNDPYKQQKYEEYLEWRKMYEPGFHLAAKQRQQNRYLRQRGATQSESSSTPTTSSGS
ncbi:hypothetical protein GE09DRAFT_1250228 [Coniochaeta sp. 2T2.1]|nr:hypothetical protein GE09DRAFT_1250228 [Coniochaeta sp. 2T2.1]